MTVGSNQGPGLMNNSYIECYDRHRIVRMRGSLRLGALKRVDESRLQSERDSNPGQCYISLFSLAL